MDRAESPDPVELRAALLLRVVESDLDDAREFLLVDLVETYFVLDGEQKHRYQQLVSRKEYRNVEDVELTWADKLLLQGQEKGVVQGKRESLVKVLETKFGSLSAKARGTLDGMDSAEELDVYLERAAKATTLQEAGLDD